MSDLTREYSELQALARDYLDGMFYADEAKLRSAFHPKCIMFGHYNGRFEESTVDDFVTEVKGVPLAPGSAYESAIIRRSLFAFNPHRLARTRRQVRPRSRGYPVIQQRMIDLFGLRGHQTIEQPCEK